MTEMNAWNYRIVSYDTLVDDGPILGMAEAYYTEIDGDLILQAWSAEPYWVQQDVNDFVVTLDKYEADLKEGIKPDWANFLDESELPTVLKMMRRGAGEPVIYEKKVFQKWGDE